MKDASVLIRICNYTKKNISIIVIIDVTLKAKLVELWSLLKTKQPYRLKGHAGMAHIAQARDTRPTKKELFRDKVVRLALSRLEQHKDEAL